MGFSVSPQSHTSLFQEMQRSQAEGSEGAEGKQGVEEGEQSAQEQLPTGTLKGEQKAYSFTLQQTSQIPEKLTPSFGEKSSPLPNKFDLAKGQNTPSEFSKQSVRQKEFQVIQSQKQAGTEERSHQEKPLQRAARQTGQLFQQKLSHLKPQTPFTPPRQTYSKEPQKPPSPLTQRKTESKKPLPSDAEKSESKRRKTPSSPTKSNSSLFEAEQKRLEEKHKKEEEGLAQRDQEREHSQKDQEEREEETSAPISERLARDILDYGLEESILSQIFDRRVSQFDVLILFFEVMKLEAKSREQERIGRKKEREMQIHHMQLLVENYKKQAADLKQSTLTAGVMGIAAGLLPIVGFLKGKWLLEKLGMIGSFFKKFQDQDPNKVFNNFSEMLSRGADMQKNFGQVQNLFGEGDRSFHQHMSELFRSDHDESTRSMEEIRDNWKNIENFLAQTLQMYHDATRQLYS